MAATLIQPVASWLIKAISGDHESRKEQEGKFILLLALLLMIQVLGKGVIRAGRGYNDKDHLNNFFEIRSILWAIPRLLSISNTNLGLMVIFQETIDLE